MSKSPRRHHEPCGCQQCPKPKRGRPPTKRECVEKWTHEYGREWPRRKVLRYAIGSFTFAYVEWVNLRGWRKPPDWSSGRVPLARLRPKGKPFTPDEFRQWERELIREMERRLGDAPARS